MSEISSAIAESEKPFLSICIPTFNREPLLKETIESILRQVSDDQNLIEIVVSDNASTDGTESLVREFQSQYRNITYFRWPENMGADRNYLQVIEQASGQYCWFLGSDDLLLDGALEKALAVIKDNKTEIVLFDRAESDARLQEAPTTTSWSTLDASFRFNTALEPEKFIEYIDACKSIGGFFSFLSVILFKKSRWDAIQNKDRFVGSAYVHVHALFSMMAEGANFLYVKEALVLCRMGNDSFCPDLSWDNIYRRVKLDIDGYTRITLHVFGSDAIISRQLLNLVERQLLLPTLVRIRFYLKSPMQTKHPLDILLLNRGYFRTYAKVNILVVLMSIIMPCLRLFRLLPDKNQRNNKRV